MLQSMLQSRAMDAGEISANLRRKKKNNLGLIGVVNGVDYCIERGMNLYMGCSIML